MIPTVKTKLYGVFGWPLGHTLSPFIHNPIFKKEKIDAIYLAIEIKPQKFNRDFIESLKTLNFGGFNLTLPYKKKVIPFLDECDETSKRIGAVNTVVNKNDKFIGYNTDRIGFYKAICSSFPSLNLKGSNVLILGAGGAAFSVAWSCLERGSETLIIANRTLQNAEQLKRKLKQKFNKKNIITFKLTDDILFKLKEGLKPVLIINATSYGLKSEKKSLIEFPYPDNPIYVMDLIYNPKTMFLKEADKKGYITADGLSMLVEQGLEAFRLWTGILPDSKNVEKTLRNILNQKNK